MPILGLAAQEGSVYPAHFDIEKLIRPNILALQPYRCARDDYQDGILLDANENALGHSLPSAPDDYHQSLDLNRYPDPAQLEIKTRYANMRGIPGPDHVFLGVGSDEVIDLLMRVCCIPAKDKVLIAPPTYGMYSVCAQVNDLGVVKVPQDTSNKTFRIRVDKIKETLAADPAIKLVFLCSPGNPTGTLVSLSDIQEILEFPSFTGIVIVDEAYVDFAGQEVSAASLIKRFANLCVMQTLSKGFGLAAIRLGVALAQPPLIQILTNTKAPYNISSPSAHLALSALSPAALEGTRAKVSTLIQSRAQLIEGLATIDDLGEPVGENHANFVILPVLNHDTKLPDSERAVKAYTMLAEKRGVVVRFRGKEHGCEGCLRITVGTSEENEAVIRELKHVLTVL